MTSAARYADAAPFDFLADAGNSGIPVLFVINKVPADPAAATELVDDFVDGLNRVFKGFEGFFVMTFNSDIRVHGDLQIKFFC